MPCITDLDNGHKQDAVVLRKYFQQGMLTYRAKRMMKRAAEELRGRWEVKSIGVSDSCPNHYGFVYRTGLADE